MEFVVIALVAVIVAFGAAFFSLLTVAGFVLAVLTIVVALFLALLVGAWRVLLAIGNWLRSTPTTTGFGDA